MNRWVRQIHRWLAVVFTITVVGAFVGATRDDPVEWAYYAPLFPLALMLLTGFYLFTLPYVTRRRPTRVG